MLLVAVLSVLFAARWEPDQHEIRPQVRYVNAVALLTLFVALYAAFGTIGSLTDPMANHSKRADASIEAQQNLAESSFFNPEDLGFGTGLPVLFPVYDFSFDSGNDSNYSFAVGSGLAALMTGAICLFHVRWRRRIYAATGGEPVVSRVHRTYHVGVCAVAALTVAVALTSFGYAVFELLAPGIAGGSGFPSEVVRAEAISELLTFGFLAVGSGLLFRGSWRAVRPVLPSVATAF